MLCSPSCSASLSERFAPLREGKIFKIHRTIEVAIKCPFIGTLLHQQLADVLKLAHVGEFLLHQLLDTAAHAHRDDLQATAGWGQGHEGQVHTLIPAQRRIVVVMRRLISAFTLKTSLNSQVTTCRHLSTKDVTTDGSDTTAGFLWEENL